MHLQRRIQHKLNFSGNVVYIATRRGDRVRGPHTPSRSTPAPHRAAPARTPRAAHASSREGWQGCGPLVRVQEQVLTTRPCAVPTVLWPPRRPGPANVERTCVRGGHGSWSHLRRVLLGDACWALSKGGFQRWSWRWKTELRAAAPRLQWHLPVHPVSRPAIVGAGVPLPKAPKGRVVACWRRERAARFPALTEAPS